MHCSPPTTIWDTISPVAAGPCKTLLRLDTSTDGLRQEKRNSLWCQAFVTLVALIRGCQWRTLDPTPGGLNLLCTLEHGSPFGYVLPGFYGRNCSSSLDQLRQQAAYRRCLLEACFATCTPQWPPINSDTRCSAEVLSTISRFLTKYPEDLLNMALLRWRVSCILVY